MNRYVLRSIHWSGGSCTYDTLSEERFRIILMAETNRFLAGELKSVSFCISDEHALQEKNLVSLNG